MDIQMSGICKAYGNPGQERVIYDDLTARFESGQVSVILGRSGAGKSSLLNLIAGIDLPDAGEITMGSIRVSDLDDTARSIFRRRHIGFVFQSFNLIPVLSVLENITLVSRLDSRDPVVYRQRALDLLSAMGLSDRGAAFPDRLSGGEQQRVALARALANDPEVILADEPTGNLDKKTGTRILELMTTQAKTLGKTLVMVTHSREAMSYADQVFTVRENRLVPGKAP